MQDGAHDTVVRIPEGDARPLRRRSGSENRQECPDPDGRHRHVRLFLQSPSFLHAQRQLGTRQGRASALALFGIGTIPCAGQFRRTPDGVPPGHAGPLFHHVHAELERSGALAPCAGPAGGCWWRQVVQNTCPPPKSAARTGGRRRRRTAACGNTTP